MRNPNLVPKSELSAQINACQAESWSELGQPHILLVWLPGLELTHTDAQHSAIEVNLLGVWPQKDTDKEALSVSHTKKNILDFIYIKKSRPRDVENIVRSLVAQQGDRAPSFYIILLLLPLDLYVYLRSKNISDFFWKKLYFCLKFTLFFTHHTFNFLLGVLFFPVSFGPDFT